MSVSDDFIECSVACPSCPVLEGTFKRLNSTAFVLSSNPNISLVQLPSEHWEFQQCGKRLCVREEIGKLLTIGRWTLVNKWFVFGIKKVWCEDLRITVNTSDEDIVVRKSETIPTTIVRTPTPPPLARAATSLEWTRSMSDQHLTFEQCNATVLRKEKGPCYPSCFARLLDSHSKICVQLISAPVNDRPGNWLSFGVAMRGMEESTSDSIGKVKNSWGVVNKRDGTKSEAIVAANSTTVGLWSRPWRVGDILSAEINTIEGWCLISLNDTDATYRFTIPRAHHSEYLFGMTLAVDHKVTILAPSSSQYYDRPAISPTRPISNYSTSSNSSLGMTSASTSPGLPVSKDAEADKRKAREKAEADAVEEDWVLDPVMLTGPINTSIFAPEDEFDPRNHLLVPSYPRLWQEINAVRVAPVPFYLMDIRIKIMRLKELSEQATWLKPKSELKQQLDDAKMAANRDFPLIARLGLSLKALEAEVESLALSDEDFMSLPAQHASLLAEVESKCNELADADKYDELNFLAEELVKLKALKMPCL